MEVSSIRFYVALYVVDFLCSTSQRSLSEQNAQINKLMMMMMTAVLVLVVNIHEIITVKLMEYERGVYQPNLFLDCWQRNRKIPICEF